MNSNISKEGEAVRDLGSFANYVHPSDADLIDHRSQAQNTVYIGVQLPKAHRRRRRRKHHDNSSSSTVTPGSTEAMAPSQRIRFLLGDEEGDEDHQTHELFCELDELQINGEEMEWKETARWIKFEEDVEEGGERWSKPHVATLSLHSLFELRCSLLSGTVLLDMSAFTLHQVIDMVLDSMIAGNQLKPENRDAVRDTLLCRHHHQHEKRHRENGSSSKMHLPIIRSLADIGKKYSEPRSLQLKGFDTIGSKSSPNFQNLTRSSSSGGGLYSLQEVETPKDFNEPTIPEVPSSHKINLHFMKKIPPGAEASNILVGEVHFLTHPITAFVRLSKSLILGDLTEVPVPTRFIFLLLGPMGNSTKYHEIGRSIATLMSDEIFHDVAYHAKSRQDLLAGIDEFLDQVTVLPPGEWDPTIRIEPPKSVPSQIARRTTPAPEGTICPGNGDGHGLDESLVRTGRIFGGLRQDIKRKVPFYKGDFKDCLNVQCLASFIYLYFACLTPIITFGGLLGDATGLQMAAFESILAGSICGIVYALFAGQPLTILGSTGPVLIFETIVYKFCSNNGFHFLEFRVWIGLWTAAMLLVVVAFDLSALVRYITRFTEESFSALISLIFIYKAIEKVVKINKKYPLRMHMEHGHGLMNGSCLCVQNDTAVKNATVAYEKFGNLSNVDYANVSLDNCESLGGMLSGGGCMPPPHYVPDVFLFCIMIFLGTFTLAMTLKMMRNTRFFRTTVRHLLSDFSVVIAIVVMVFIDLAIGLPTPKLKVPGEFKPTSTSRGWFISPIESNPWYLSLAAVIPAALATILIFMDQQITAVIVNRKENKLVKGHGYHLDLLIILLLILLCSLLGLPWFVAATVLSITHVMSLKKESKCTAPGDSAKFLGVCEQRVTGVAIFLTIGLSVLFTSVLRRIPMAVLYGVFLYMGVSSLKGVQLIDRIRILFMPQKFQPDLMYLRHVRTIKVHLFTLIQVACLAILWTIKTVEQIAIAFPLMVLAMCFIRKGLERIFTQTELKWLDDIMPESHKRAREDEEKKCEDGEEEEAGVYEMSTMQVKLEVQASSLNMDKQVNISEEMAKTGIWKTILAHDSANSMHAVDETTPAKHESKSRHHRSHKKKELPSIPDSRENNSSDEDLRKKKKKTPVTFFIDEEETNSLMVDTPEIVIQCPSEASTPINGRGDIGS